MTPRRLAPPPQRGDPCSEELKRHCREDNFILATTQYPIERFQQVSFLDGLRNRFASHSNRECRQGPRAKRVREPGGARAGFIPMHVIAAVGSVQEVVHRRGHVVRVPVLFDGDCLRRVLKVLNGQGDG